MAKIKISLYSVETTNNLQEYVYNIENTKETEITPYMFRQVYTLFKRDSALPMQSMRFETYSTGMLLIIKVKDNHDQIKSG